MIGDVTELDAKKVGRVVVCAGRVYYDLFNARKEAGNDELAIVRLEQLYPFPTEQLAAELAAYPNARGTDVGAEEPKNQGAWYQIRHRLEKLLSPKTNPAVRRPSVVRFAGRGFTCPSTSPSSSRWLARPWPK